MISSVSRNLVNKPTNPQTMYAPVANVIF